MKVAVETKEAVEKVKERDMGYLFENMEKMDIQEERRNTAEAKRQLEEALKREKEAKEKEKEAKEKEKEASKKTIITMCQEFELSKEDTLKQLMEKSNITAEEAQKALQRYWTK